MNPDAISATASDLPDAVAAALAAPSAGIPIAVAAAGTRWAALTWGRPDDPPLLLVHGVTSSSATWWRVGPALAAAGHHVVAVDLPGHGGTGAWLGHHRFRDTARDLASFIGEARIARPDLSVVGHSWGAMTVAALPAAGVSPAALVLLDPPAMPRATIARILDEPGEQRFDDLDEAVTAIRRTYPGWTDGDVLAKAKGLTEFDEAAVRAVVLGNDWDGGLADLADEGAAGVSVWIIRGEPAAGGYVEPGAVAALERRVGPGRLLTIVGGPHSPQRTHPEATILAVLMALGRLSPP